MDNLLANFHFDCVVEYLDCNCFRICEEMIVTTNAKETKTIVKPSSNFFLWCPFCDDCATVDSMIARKRLGIHIVNKHPEEVRFKKGVTPPALEDID